MEIEVENTVANKAEMIVTDNNAVFNGNIAWVTPKTYAAIKAKSKVV